MQIDTEIDQTFINILIPAPPVDHKRRFTPVQFAHIGAESQRLQPKEPMRPTHSVDNFLTPKRRKSEGYKTLAAGRSVRIV